jgi:type II restriction enzyme
LLIGIRYLIIGKDDIEDVLRRLLKHQPKIAEVFPILLASREFEFTVLHEFNADGFSYKTFNFTNIKTLSPQEIEDSIEFLRSSGFLELMQSKKIKNLVDFVIGTEAGMDTNGRKNRSGHSMEDIVEFYIQDICKKQNWKYLKGANASKLKSEWKIDLPVDKSSRILDFVVKTNLSIYLIETNFYGGGGSKLKSTAKEYQEMYKYWTKSNFKFIWITDGEGWQTARHPLRESFNELDYILNLDMLSKSILEDIFIQDM